MAEAIALVGVVASIVQLVDFGSKVLHRLNDFQSSLGEIPKIFRHVKAELPILLETLNQTKDAVEKGSMKEETKKALLLVVDECQTQITLLDDLISRSIPQDGDSWRKKTRKAMLSLGQDAKVVKITTILRTHIQSLTNYRVAALTKLQAAGDMNVQLRTNGRYVDPYVAIELTQEKNARFPLVTIFHFRGTDDLWAGAQCLRS